MARVFSLNRERARREMRRRAALRREREFQGVMRKIQANALMFLKRCLELGQTRFRFVFAVGGERFVLTLERIGDKPLPPPNDGA